MTSHSRFLRGMTLLELVLAYLVLALILSGLVGLGAYVQREAKIRQAQEMVMLLRDATIAYHQTRSEYPHGLVDGDPQSALQSLLEETASAARLSAWPGKQSATNTVLEDLKDPWGRDWRYWAIARADSHYRERLATEHGLPIFESAGPDGRFGLKEPIYRSDNIASDLAMMWQVNE